MKKGKDIARTYKRQQIESASPGELVLMLYDGAVEYLRRAEAVLDGEEPDWIEKFHNHLISAQNIVTELMVSLDLEKGGEVAQNLFRLYEYMHHRLVTANLEKDKEILQEICRLLGRLREAWVVVVDREKNEKVEKAEEEQEKKPPGGLNIQG